MFIILGRDPDGANIVQLWAERREAAGGDPEHVAQVKAIAAAMREWAANPEHAPETAPPANAYPTLEQSTLENKELREALSPAIEMLKSLRVLCDACEQPLYMKIVDEVLAALNRSTDHGK
jgi:hypothetical protein